MLSNTLVIAPVVFAATATLVAGWVLWKRSHLIVPLDHWKKICAALEDYDRLRSEPERRNGTAENDVSEERLAVEDPEEVTKLKAQVQELTTELGVLRLRSERVLERSTHPGSFQPNAAQHGPTLQPHGTDDHEPSNLRGRAAIRVKLAETTRQTVELQAEVRDARSAQAIATEDVKRLRLELKKAHEEVENQRVTVEQHETAAVDARKRAAEATANAERLQADMSLLEVTCEKLTDELELSSETQARLATELHRTASEPEATASVSAGLMAMSAAPNE